jgi:hypothetical protein
MDFNTTNPMAKPIMNAMRKTVVVFGLELMVLFPLRMG